MEFDCPVCHAQLAVQGNSAHCEHCAKDYVVEARCPDCHKPLEFKSLRRGGYSASTVTG